MPRQGAGRPPFGHRKATAWDAPPGAALDQSREAALALSLHSSAPVNSWCPLLTVVCLSFSTTTRAEDQDGGATAGTEAEEMEPGAPEASVSPSEPQAERSPEDAEQARANAARALAYSAERAFERRDFEEASQAARAAYRLVPAPTLVLLEARALEQLGQWNEAVARYRIAAGPSPLPMNEVFRRAQGEATAELVALEQRIPQLKISVRDTAAPRTEVRLDGILLPDESLDLWLPQDPGRHLVTFADGSGGEERYEVELKGGDQKPLIVGNPPRVKKRDPRVPAGWASLALGGAALATGAGLAIRANNLEGRLESNCPGGNCPPAEHETLSDYRTARDLSTGATIVGISGLAAGSVLLWVWPLLDKPENSWTASINPTSVSLKGTF